MDARTYGELESQRARAFDIGNATSYFRLCKELGLSERDLALPERRLYNVGRQPEFCFDGDLEISVVKDETEPITKIRKRRVKTGTYRTFLDIGRDIPTNDVTAMRNLLFSTFGRRFSPHGKTPLYKMDDHQIFGAFSGILSYAKRRLESN